MTDKIDMGYSCDIRITAHCGFPYRFAYVQIFPCISVGYINIIQRNILHIVRFVFIINTAGNCTGHFRIRGSYVRYIHAVNAANLFFIVFKAVAKPNSKRRTDSVHFYIRNGYIRNITTVAGFYRYSGIPARDSARQEEIAVFNGYAAHIHLRFRAYFKAVCVTGDYAVRFIHVSDLLIAWF